MTFRNLARVGTAGLLAAGTIAFAAAPAFAADVDFGLDLKGTTIAADASGKLGTVSFTNNGSSKPELVEVLFDATNLDQHKVTIDLGDCTFDSAIADCIIDESAIPGPGETADLAVPFVKQAGATGAAGSLTVTVKAAGDTNKANDSKTVKVNVGASGVDLRVIAPDVTGYDASGNPTGKAVEPGATSLVWGYVLNQGDKIAAGLKVQVSLPEDVTFAEAEDGCQYSADKRKVTCDYAEISLIPADLDNDPQKSASAAGFFFPVTVSADATGPASLKGGEFIASAITQDAVDDASKLAKRARTALPANARSLTDDQADLLDVDATDNTDGFAVLVAGTGGEGGGTGDDGGLPLTGPVAASVAAAGAAVVAVGAFLFFAARRRRIVLVTPGDGK